MSNPLAGNSVDNNGKRTKLPALATVAMLLVSAMSFAAVGPAFATEDKEEDEAGNIDQIIAQIQEQVVSGEGNVSDVVQDNAQIAEQLANGDGNVTQDILQLSSQIVESGGNVTGVDQSNAQIASQSAGELLEDEEEE